jgi:predicted Zn-dependent protease
LEFANKAQSLAPSDPVVTATLGSLLYQTGNFSWAYSLLKESARQNPADVAVLERLAWAEYSMGKVEDARQTMERVVQSAPDSSQATSAKRFLSLVALNPGNPGLDAAQPEVEKLLQTDPKYVPALMARAAFQMERGDSKAAAGTFADILQIYPDFAPAMKYFAALSLGDPQKLAKAHDLAAKARLALPDDPELAQILGAISFERKEYGYSVQLFQESARKRSLDTKSLYYYGMAQLQTKERTKGSEALERALSAGLQEPFATSAKRALEEARKE